MEACVAVSSANGFDEEGLLFVVNLKRGKTTKTHPSFMRKMFEIASGCSRDPTWLLFANNELGWKIDVGVQVVVQTILTTGKREVSRN